MLGVTGGMWDAAATFRGVVAGVVLISVVKRSVVSIFESLEEVAASASLCRAKVGDTWAFGRSKWQTDRQYRNWDSSLWTPWCIPCVRFLSVYLCRNTSCEHIITTATHGEKCPLTPKRPPAEWMIWLDFGVSSCINLHFNRRKQIFLKLLYPFNTLRSSYGINCFIAH